MAHSAVVRGKWRDFPSNSSDLGCLHTWFSHSSGLWPCLALSHQAVLVFLLKAFDKNMRGVRCEAQHPAACCLEQVVNGGVQLPPPLTLSLFCSGRILLDTCVPVHHGLMASYCLSDPRSGQRALYSLPGLYTCWAFSRLKTTWCGHQF